MNLATSGDGSEGASPRLLSVQMGTAQALLEAVMDPAVLVGADLRPVAWNEPFLALVGRSVEAVERVEACHELIRLEACGGQSLAAQALASACAVRMQGTQAVISIGADSRRVRVTVTAVPMLLEDKRPVALEIYREVGSPHDGQEIESMLLLERDRAKSLEKEIRATAAELSESKRELERARDRLVQSEKLSSLGTLVAGLAHELNNPINFIYGNVSFLREYVSALEKVVDAYGTLELNAVDQRDMQAVKQSVNYDYVREDLSKVLAALSNGVRRAAGIVQSLRTFIHPGSDRSSETSDLGAIAANTLDLVAPEFRDRIRFDCQREANLPMTQGSEGRINQVMMNLVMNAVQAIPAEGLVEVVVRRETEGAVDGVACVVRDSGVGVAPEQLSQIFEPFFTTKPAGEGTGLGLSISYSIVESHGGSLTAESQKGQGTTFKLWLPANSGGAN